MAITFNGTTNNITGATSLNALTIPTLGFGKVLQVVEGTVATQVLSTSTSTWSDTGLTASITPSSTSSKIFVLISQALGVYGSSTGWVVGSCQIVRSGISLRAYPGAIGTNAALGSSYLENYATCCFTLLDSPSSTSSLTYKTQIKIQGASATSPNVAAQAYSCPSSIILVEIGP